MPSFYVYQNHSILFKTAAILYFACFTCYIFFSRKPDYFDSEYTKGIVVVNSTGNKEVEYLIDNINYTIPLHGWGASPVAKGQPVTVIYNPSVPSDGSMYTFFNYWITLPELLLTACVFIVLLYAAVFITGKEEPYWYTEEEKRKRRKYDD